MVIINCSHLELLLEALKKEGYSIIGPTRSGTAIVLDKIHSMADLPVNLRDEQRPASYRLTQRNDQAYFGYASGPQSWKNFLFPPVLSMMKARREGKSFKLENGEDRGGVSGNGKDSPMLAFFGVHACDLHALRIHDKVLSEGPYADQYYKMVREKLFVVAVNCTEAGGTCFCASMGTGPRVTEGFDIALTERINGSVHEFIVETGSDRGARMLKGIPNRPIEKPGAIDLEKMMEQARSRMGRKLETNGLKEKLQENFEHRRWDEVAKRCLACANCTMVCPTCFCSTVEDVTDLSGGNAERIRKWDSCFTLEFSYIHGGSIRPSIRSRYRQWLTHKLSSWIDQFGTSGCVGCGRCITWCPVGIDITEEAGAIAQEQSRLSTNS